VPQPPRPAALLLLGTLALVAACTPDLAGTSDPGATSAAPVVEVTSTDDACDLSATEAPAGPVRFRVENAGSDVTELYVLAADGLAIESEVENIGPGLTRELVVTLEPGTYVVACKPGMVGDGIRSTFTVTGAAR
jgi:iron uptake system component EfeO